MNTVPTENSQEATALEALLSWLPWVVGAVVVVAITVWVVRRLHSGGQLVDLSSWAKRFLVKRATPSEAPKDPSPAIEGESPAWLTRVLGTAAALPTLFALPWAAWAVAHVLPVPIYISLPLGVLFDLVMVASVVLALLVPSVSRQASLLGWAAAALASAAIVVHVGWSGAILFAATPLLSKALWGLLVTIRRAEIKARAEEKRQQEEAERERERIEAERAAAEAEAARLAAEEKARKDAELSTDLSHERKVELARLEEDAKYIEEKAERELRVDEAKAKADHAKKVAEIGRLGAEQRAMDEESAKVEIARQDLIRKVNASRPSSFALPAGEVPNDLSGISSPAPAAREGAIDHLTLLGFGGDAPKPTRPVVAPLELEARAREVYEPGMSLNAFRQALGVGMTKAHPLHQKLRAESGATG